MTAERSTGAVNALRVAISRLRGVLGGPDPTSTPDATGRIRAQRGAWRRLDAATVRAPAAEGRRLVLASGDGEQRRHVCAKRSGIWRGAPLADLAMVEYLNRDPPIARLTAADVIERIDADLALGAGAS